LHEEGEGKCGGGVDFFLMEERELIRKEGGDRNSGNEWEGIKEVLGAADQEKDNKLKGGRGGVTTRKGDVGLPDLGAKGRREQIWKEEEEGKGGGIYHNGRGR